MKYTKTTTKSPISKGQKDKLIEGMLDVKGIIELFSPIKGGK